MAIIKVKVNLDTTQANKDLTSFEGRLNKLRSNTINVKINMQGANAQAIVSLERLTSGQTKLAIAQQKTEQITQKRIISENQLATAQQKTQQAVLASEKAEKNLQTAREKTEQAVQKRITSENNLERATTNASSKSVSGLNKTSTVASKTGDTIGKLAGKVAQWAAATTLIYGPIRAFEAALDTMRQVDDTLVEVRKVTDLNNQELAELESNAYKVASAYGESADAYLSAVAEFARAGYEEQSAALAELSLKTQIVGDVSAETANQFLLSVDAAYKLQGNIEALTKVLDGANEIDNEYATSIQKIAEGLGIVAPVAAQAGVGIDEVTAAIGTITAVTQRSGSEAARAFRALILNILGDTKTEIDEGVTWTTGEIAGLKDVIKTYASDAYKAAQATGELINPMEAIGGLAQSMEDGLLTEAQLMEMVSDIGGKLRTSQLLALIQNWDMYESMLKDYENAFGSADKEVENALDSWSRKVNVLQNTWTEFVAGLVSTDAIKGGLDVVTGAINLLDTSLGRALVTVTALTLGVSLLQKGARVFSDTLAGNTIKNVVSLVKALIEAKKGSEAAASALTFMGKSLTALKITGVVAAIAALVGGVVALSDALHTSFAEATEQVSNTQSEIAAIDSEYQSLILKGNDLTASEERRKQVLESQLQILKDQLALDYQEQYNKWSGNQYTDFNDDYLTSDDPFNTPLRITGNEAAIRDMTDGYNELRKELDSGEKSQAEYLAGLREIIAAQSEDVELLKTWQDAGIELNDLDLKRISTYDNLVDITADVAEKEEAASEATDGATDSISEQVAALGDLQNEITAANSAIDNFRSNMENEGEKGDAFKQYADIYSGFLEQFEQGLYGSNEYRNAIKLFLPDTFLEEIGYDWVLAGQTLASDFWQGIFSEGGEDYGAIFANKLYEMAKDSGGEIKDANGDIIASFEQVGDSINMSIEDIDALAEKLNTTPEIIAAVLDATNIYSQSVTYTAEEAMSVIEQLDGVVTETANGIKEIDVSALAQQLKSLDVPTEDIYALIDALEQADDVKLTNIPASLSDIEAQAEDTTDSLEDLGDTKVEPKIGADATEWWEAYREVKDTAQKLANQVVNVKIKGTLSNFFGRTFAKGTQNAKGGPALVNDGNGPELIAANGMAYIAGDGDPTITDLPQGAKVYTAEETKRILDGKKLSGPIPAFASGYSPNIPIYKPSGGSSSGSTSRPSSSGSSSSSSSNADITEDLEEKYDQMRDELDALLQDLEHQIFHMEIKGNMATEMVNMYRRMQDELHKLAEEYRAQGLDENSDYIQELQEQWQDYEDEITKIAEDLWDELDEAIGKQLEKVSKIKDAEIDAIDAQIESLKQTAEKEDELLELEEKRLAVAEAQEALSKAQAERTIRVYNSQKKQWEWVADAEQVQNAQEQLEEAEKNYEEYLKDKELNDKIAALEERKEAIEAQYDAYEQMWEAITESVAEPTRNISDILSDISQNGLPAMKDAVSSVTDLLWQLGNYNTGVAGSGTGGSVIGGNGGTNGSKDYKKDTTDYAALMLAAPDIQTFKYFADERLKKIQAQGIDLGAQGWETNNELYKMWESSRKKYDSGGVLYGLGGIKATPQPEIVLPPDITKALLEPQNNRMFEARLNELAYLYGGRGGMDYGTGKILNNNSSVTNNGGPYYFGNIEISEQDANTLTIADLARQARNLSLYSNAY